MATLAVYPGSFDPLTNGHVDIITRGARLFDRIIVAILVNAEKAPLFTMDERVEIARAVFKDQPNVEVDTFDGLLVDYVERRKADVIVRGLRAVSDFEFEFQMALMNRRLNAKIETVFMMPAEQYTYISSRLIKEVFALGGRVHGLVPDMVEARLRDKVSMATETRRRSGTSRTGRGHDELAERTGQRISRIADDEGDGDGGPAAARRRRGDRLSAPASPISRRPSSERRPRTRRSTPTSRSTRRTPASPS